MGDGRSGRGVCVGRRDCDGGEWECRGEGEGCEGVKMCSYLFVLYLEKVSGIFSGYVVGNVQNFFTHFATGFFRTWASRGLVSQFRMVDIAWAGEAPLEFRNHFHLPYHPRHSTGSLLFKDLMRYHAIKPSKDQT